MKFIVSSTYLLKQLQVLGGVINNSNTLPILDNFLFELSQSKLTISASDLETTMSATIDVESDSENSEEPKINPFKLKDKIYVGSGVNALFGNTPIENKTEVKIFDGLLVLQFKAGDKKALELLVKRWHSKLCNQANWYTKDSDLAKDIVQESWGRILKKIHTLKEPNNFGSWASKIVIRKSIDYLRKNNNEELKMLPQNFIYAQANGNYLNVVFYDKDQNIQNEIIRNSISKLVNNVSDYSFIIQVHRSSIVNLHYVKSIKGPIKNTMLKLEFKSEEVGFSVARSKVDEVKEAYNSFKNI